jgi:hypothetical protein
VWASPVVVLLSRVFVLEAAVEVNPRKARGLDGTLKSFAHTSAGPWLLVLIALGLVAFSLYSVAEAWLADL